MRSGLKRKDVRLRELVGRFRVQFLDRRERLLDLLGSANGSRLAGAGVDLPELAVLRLEEVLAVEPGADVTAGVPCRPNVNAAAGLKSSASVTGWFVTRFSGSGRGLAERRAV